jgi:integrase
MQKPSKPRPDFPLFPHGNGQWAKKFYLNGKHTPKYFGSWKDDPKGEQAIRDYLARKDAILAGLDSLGAEVVSDTMTVVEMLKRFLTAKHSQLQAGDLADETFNDYTYELQLFADLLGPDAKAAALGPEEFRRYLEHVRSTRKLGPHRLGTVVRYVRAAFNHAGANGWIPRVNFGTDFKAPNTDPESIAIRKVRQGGDAEDDPIYTPAQLEWLLSHATKQFRAMILVMVNCGMGPSDVARLKWQHIDFETGRLSLRRSKNGIRRECWLWKKTRAALMELRKLKHTREALEKDAGSALVFITRKGLAYVRRERVMDGDRVKKTKVSNAISITIGRMIKDAKAAGVIPAGQKITAYNFRHTFRTHADNCPDLNAVLRTMGRKLYGQSDHRYVRGRFRLGRLKRVSKTVYRHLFPKPKPPVTKPESPERPRMRLVGGEADSDAA